MENLASAPPRVREPASSKGCMMEHLTQENAPQYVGKTIYSSRPRFHYYPLRVLCHRGVFMVADRNHVAYEIPPKNDLGGGIPFDFVK